jgi:hypothetical protein
VHQRSLQTHGKHWKTNQRAEWHDSWNVTSFLSKTNTFRQPTAKFINVRYWPNADIPLCRI